VTAFRKRIRKYKSDVPLHLLPFTRKQMINEIVSAGLLARSLLSTFPLMWQTPFHEQWYVEISRMSDELRVMSGSRSFTHHSLLITHHKNLQLRG
jgi:hypothetical protein